MILARSQTTWARKSFWKCQGFCSSLWRMDHRITRNSPWNSCGSSWHGVTRAAQMFLSITNSTYSHFHRVILSFSGRASLLLNSREVCGSASASAYIGGMPAVLRQLEQPARAILFEFHQQVLLHHSLCSVACFSIFSSATFHYISISILSWLVFPLYCLAWKWGQT